MKVSTYTLGSDPNNIEIYRRVIRHFSPAKFEVYL
jgi:hypothetical protein